MATEGKRLGSLEELFDRADIVDVAQRLGLQVDKGKTRPRRALCPFHNDTIPSLNLYEARAGDGPHYHCFACGSHGDLIGLVRKVKRLSFPDAVRWLAEALNVELATSQQVRVDSRTATAALTSLIAQTRSERFDAFCDARAFPVDFMRNHGIGVVSLNGLIERARNDKVFAEALIEAGIARQADTTELQSEFWRGGLRAFFGGERVVFRIDHADGAVAGFAARALGDDSPKYLYSSRFPRKQTLYGAHEILRDLRATKETQEPFRLYVVEGILDALRLAAVGLPAVAVLGSALTAEQSLVLGEILANAREKHGALGIDLFFDPDAAGRKGAFSALAHLLNLQVEHGPFDIRTIVPGAISGTKNDPDAYLREKSQELAEREIEKAAVPALIFLANHLMRRPIGAEFGGSSTGERAMAARRIVESFDRTGLTYFLEQFEIPAGWEPFVDSLRVFLQGRLPAPAARARKGDAPAKTAPEDRSALLRALSLCRSTMLRREYAFDNAALDRLSMAASALYHVHVARLGHEYAPSAPYLARHVPKTDGRMRLKCGPVAEDLLLQMYVLQDLLRSHAAADLIPAIRSPAVRSDVDGRAFLTGTRALREDTVREAISFAYQVDMAIVDGVATPDRAGLFRDYFACWRDFIAHIDQRLARMPHEIVCVTRLDIMGFYDNVRRVDVRDALHPFLRQACERLDAIGEPLVPLICPDRTPTERADAILDFLLQHSFGYIYTDPVTGAEVRSPADRGLPQGPDLSAYLANVVLFGLDAIMADEIEALDAAAKAAFPEKAVSCGGAYARYVDDMVLVCPDAATLRRLQRRIEAYLARIGLRLNRKNLTPPPMARRDARLWVTANRTGFGFSGPISEMLPVAFFDPLTDAGDIRVDRKLALGLLHDPGLGETGIYVGEDGSSAIEGEKRAYAVARLKAALSAPELRNNDRITAYRWLWLMAAADASEIAIAPRFIELVVEVEDRKIRTFTANEAYERAVAMYDALERVMRIDLSLAEAENQDRQTFVLLRNKLAESQPHKLADTASESLFELAGPEGVSASQKFLNRFDIAAQRLVILNAAFAQVRGLSALAVDTTSIARGIALEQFGSLWTTLRRHLAGIPAPKAYAPVERDELVRSVFAALHQDIVGIERWAAGAREEPEFGPVIGDAVSPLLESANAIRAVWLKKAVENPGEPHRDAAAALVNMASRRLSEVFAGWRQLLPILLGKEDSHIELRAIPQPPGLRVNASLLIGAAKVEKRKLILVEFDEVDEDEAEHRAEHSPRAVVGIAWPENPVLRLGNLRIYEVLLDNFQPMVEKESRDDSPTAIASVYRGLFRSLPEVEAGRQLIPTAHSFFVQENTKEPQYRVIAWTARDTAAKSHAFVRSGDGLQVVEVPERDARHWRFGWAVCDLFDHLDFVRDEQDADGDTIVSHRAQIAHAIVRRTMRRLIGPDTFGAGAVLKPGELPSRIGRAVRLLEAHGATQEDPAGAATIAAAAFAHGVMVHERIERPGFFWRPGGLAGVLRRATHRGARALRRAAENWTFEPFFDSTGLRRCVAAWFALGARLADEASKLPETVGADLAPLIAGCRLEAVTVGLRRLALDLVALGGPEALNGLHALKPDPDELESLIGSDIVLIETGEEALGRQVDALHDALTTIVGHGREPFQPITALGWAVLVGTLLNTLPRVQTGAELLRPTVPKSAQRSEEASAALKFLIDLTRLRDNGTNEEGAEPQDIFLPYVQIEAERWSQARAALEALDTAAGLRVETIDSFHAPFERRLSDRGRYILILEDRREFALPSWCVNRANLQGDSFSPEARLTGAQRVFRFSLVSSEIAILSVDLLSMQFARTAFGDAVEHAADAEMARRQPPYRHSPASSENEGQENRGRSAAPAGTDQDRPHENVESPRQPTEKTPTSPFPTRSSDDGEIRSIVSRNAASWAKRKVLPGMHRVALVQWDVSDTYQSPEEHDGRHEGLVQWDHSQAAFVPLRNPRPGERMSPLSRKVISVQEFRRRAILTAVLEACKAFEVEGLVLPEYSMRPETVNWLARRLAEQEHPRAIWAGTFRVPGGQTLALDHLVPKYRHGKASDVSTRGDIPDYAAVIPCVYRAPLDTRGFMRPRNSSTEVLIQDRLKRHPSVAVDELIRPLGTEWAPLFAGTFWGHMHLQSFTAELVCSEIFLHASSGNIPGAIAAAEHLKERLGMRGDNEETSKIIMDEILSLSRYTSFQGWFSGDVGRRDELQRTVLIVPAMTSRSADYHIFGQNHHLASGLITVFVNAACDSYGNGESCFIGLDAWKEMEVKDSPYGDVGPGIFHFRRDGFGPLGAKESAMVIADIDPIHSTDHKPRPHFQPRPLRLIAHLPLIFATKYCTGVGPTERGDYPVGHRAIRREVILSEEPGNTFAITIAKAWSNAIDKCGNHKFEHRDVTRALEILERFADDPKWLMKRREALQKKNHVYPQRAIPPPALGDWVFVDDAWPTDPATLKRFADPEQWTDDEPWLEFPDLSEDGGSKS